MLGVGAFPRVKTSLRVIKKLDYKLGVFTVPMPFHMKVTCELVATVRPLTMGGGLQENKIEPTLIQR